MTKTNWYNKSNIRSVVNKNWSIIEGSLESGDKVVYAREFVNEKLKGPWTLAFLILHLPLIYK